MKCIVFLSLILLNIESNNVYLWVDNYSGSDETLTNMLKSEMQFLSSLPKLMNYFEKVDFYFIEKACADMNSCPTSYVDSVILSKFNKSSYTLFNQMQNTEDLIRTIKEFDENFKLLSHLAANEKISDSKVTVYLLDENVAPPSFLEANDNVTPSRSTLNILTYSSKTHRINLRSDNVISVPNKKKGLVDDGVFLKFENSIFFYAFSGSITHNNVSISLQISLASVVLNESSQNNTSSQLTLKFTGTEPYESVFVKFSFGTTRNQWNCISINAKLVHKASENGVADDSIDFQCQSLRATLGMSYTCDDFKFYQKYPGNGDVISIIFGQIQPFVTATQSSQSKFGYSDSCVYFITVPIISGLIVALLLILLASLSINSLSNIKGLTRFENQNEFVYFGNTIN